MPLFKALPTGTIVGTTDTQTLTNKTHSGIFVQTEAATNTGMKLINTNSGGKDWQLLTTATGSGFGAGTLTLYNNTDSKNAFVASSTGAMAITGTNTNDSAAAGYVGEYVSSTIPLGSAVALTTATAKTVTSISLTAGDWDVYGVVHYISAATTSIGGRYMSLSTTTDSVNATVGQYDAVLGTAAFVPGTNEFAMGNATSRFSLSGTTTIYLTTLCTFTISTLSAFGVIRARRVR